MLTLALKGLTLSELSLARTLLGVWAGLSLLSALPFLSSLLEAATTQIRMKGPVKRQKLSLGCSVGLT